LLSISIVRFSTGLHSSISKRGLQPSRWNTYLYHIWIPFERNNSRVLISAINIKDQFALSLALPIHSRTVLVSFARSAQKIFCAPRSRLSFLGSGFLVLLWRVNHVSTPWRTALVCARILLPLVARSYKKGPFHLFTYCFWLLSFPLLSNRLSNLISQRYSILRDSLSKFLVDQLPNTFVRDFENMAKEQPWDYVPSLPLAIVATVVFASLTILHTFRLFRTRTWFCIPFILGGACEFKNTHIIDIILTMSLQLKQLDMGHAQPVILTWTLSRHTLFKRF
jgi:hypothetical protein